ncbi:alpha/beta fold hydrolase [Streptomyces lasiicapitis]|uniref:alpha/beta fold hydrolase n=1 Tax=Streptomyces lasiicapitis TaxID=1923961 RepID=UPI00369EAF7D
MEEPTRHNVSIGGRRLSCLDFGGQGQPLLALHGHFGEGSTFTRLARELGPDWRVIAPDQRGHGESERAEDFSRDGYVSDAAAVLDHFGVTDTMVLGHSLGGVNAYQLATPSMRPTRRDSPPWSGTSSKTCDRTREFARRAASARMNWPHES